MKTRSTLLILLIIITLMVSGCSKNIGKPAATPTADTAAFKPMVNATGMVVPARWAVLSAQTSGVVGEVLVLDGDVVKTGQPLLKMNGIEAASAGVTSARLELNEAQKAYDNLIVDSAAKAAQAQMDIVSANTMINTASKALDTYAQTGYLDDVKQAQSDVDREKTQLDLAQKDYDKYASQPETNSTRQYYADRLADQQRDYDAAVRDLLALQMKKQQAEADLAAGQAKLVTAQQEYESRKDGPSDADQLSVETRLENAKAQLKSAETYLYQLSLPAPFDGVVSSPKVRVGELIAAGQPLMYLSDPSTMQVETTDLNEIDVARLQLGDSAIVTFDALPDISVNGKVSHIATRAADGAGVNYTVVITLNEVPAGLLWGMTAYVEVAVQK